MYLLVCVITFNYYKFKYLIFLQFQKCRPDINRLEAGQRQDTEHIQDTDTALISFVSL